MRVILIAMFLIAGQTAFAATVLGTRVDVIAWAGGPAEDPDLTDFNHTIDVGQASAAAVSPHAGASADGFADYGVIKVIAQANSQDGGYIGSANATGSWMDIVTLSSGVFNGQQARITASVTMEGYISPVGKGGGSAQLDFRMGNAHTTVNGAWNNDTPVNATGFPASGLSVQPGGTLFYSNTHDVTLTITLGNSFILSEELSVGAGSKPACGTNPACLNGASGSVDVDFGHSSYWGGFKSIAVRNASGLFEQQDLSLFTLIADSGTDYSKSFVPQPVPLPGAVWLFGPALALLRLSGSRPGETRRGPARSCCEDTRI